MKKLDYCPECSIGLNSRESEMGFCQNCKHNWDDNDIDDITELIIKIPLIVANRHNPCTSPDPDDRCENCNCWKSTRANCS